MSEGTPTRGARTVTSAVIASALFTAACAVFAITFVAARGGLTMPTAGSLPPVAHASPGPSPSPADSPTLEPSVPPATAVPTVAPTPAPTPAPTLEPAPIPSATPIAPPPTPGPSNGRPTLEPGDRLLALPGCPGHPGCFEYVVQRFDTLSGIITRYLLDYDVLAVLNPSLVDPSLIVTGQTLFLGRDPFVLLDPCPDGEACLLYVVRAGDSLAAIASRFAIEREAILAANPDMPRPLRVGQVLKLPLTP